MKCSTYMKPLGVLSLALMLSACGSDEDETTEEEGSKQEEVSEESSETEEDSTEETENEAEPLISEADVHNDDSLTALANKSNFLSEDYVPEDLVPVEVPTVLESPEVNQLRQDASSALTEMFNAASEDNITLYARSGYRSYNTQVSLYNNYKDAHGEAEADRFSARPGASEHQTGLAMDVTSESVGLELSEAFGETEEGIWVRENAHRFGFIIRYPEGMEDVTGYMYEPWHLRYLGEELAADVYESGLTYEEYIIESGIDINEG
ncbi:M15 family metallopeptidase [Salinicoccus roseus]|uniref:M15 family metallopeptidase n=1 Tax=Salinicoccus roseus TaxID=45670 RepID=UPI001EF4DF64|nr:M15 family metallopeptidase [Salinicoccus roseus]MCG7333609.1 M15 family metallopeptidase [Salinicoccus roseus]